MTDTLIRLHRFRRAVHDPGGALPEYTDAEIADAFVQAGETYPSAGETVLFAAAVVYGLEWKLAAAAVEVSYKQNESSEDKSDMFKAYATLHKVWKQKLDEALDDEVQTRNVPVAWATLRYTPPRKQDIPGS
jgi:hypothetical protein